jgi:hypothetical protein
MYRYDTDIATLMTDTVTVTETTNSKFQAVIENITAKIQQEHEKPSKKVTE